MMSWSWSSPRSCWLFAKVQHQYVEDGASSANLALACASTIATLYENGVLQAWLIMNCGGCRSLAMNSTQEHLNLAVSGLVKYSLTSYMSNTFHCKARSWQGLSLWQGPLTMSPAAKDFRINS